MTIPGQLGRVSSLFPYIEKDWWRDAYNETYLYADGDCVEDPTVTAKECDGLLNIPRVQKLFQNATSITPVKVLDLCCGQGRHTIHLAKRFPAVHFHGVDQSTYLLDIAQERAKAEDLTRNTKFEAGDARQIPVADDNFDVIVLLGNSFGHGNEQDNLQTVREARRVLKPGGIFIIDYVDGEWMRANFTQSGWEWLDTELVAKANKQLRSITASMKLLACRERELSPDKKLLASREIVIDLAAPAVHQDLFYSVRMYDLDEMEGLLHRAGLCMQPQDAQQINGPKNENGAADAGMMECRQLVVAHKPGVTSTAPATALTPLVPQDADLYIHPHLTPDYDPEKGRSLRVSESVPVGTVLVVDPPYAVVPSEHPSTHDAIMCSNIICRRQVPQAIAVRCPNDCIQDIVWCNDHCRATGQATHDFECDWLKQHGTTIREKEDEYTLSMLWIIVQIYAGRHLEMQAKSGSHQHYPWQDKFPYGWRGMDDLRDNMDLWPQAELDIWRRQIETYLSNHQGLPDTEEVLMLVSKEESNAFGLYPGATGIIPFTDQPHKRGPQYALACYPRATMANHSCFPNVSFFDHISMDSEY